MSEKYEPLEVKAKLVFKPEEMATFLRGLADIAEKSTPVGYKVVLKVDYKEVKVQ